MPTLNQILTLVNNLPNRDNHDCYYNFLAEVKNLNFDTSLINEKNSVFLYSFEGNQGFPIYLKIKTKQGKPTIELNPIQNQEVQDENIAIFNQKMAA